MRRTLKSLVMLLAVTIAAIAAPPTAIAETTMDYEVIANVDYAQTYVAVEAYAQPVSPCVAVIQPIHIIGCYQPDSVNTSGRLNQGSFCRSVVAPAGPMLKFSPLYADMSTEYKTCIAANTGESVAFDIGRHSRIPAESENDAVPPGVKLRPTVRSGTGNAVRI